MCVGQYAYLRVDVCSTLTFYTKVCILSFFILLVALQMITCRAPLLRRDAGNIPGGRHCRPGLLQDPGGAGPLCGRSCGTDRGRADDPLYSNLQITGIPAAAGCRDALWCLAGLPVGLRSLAVPLPEGPGKIADIVETAVQSDFLNSMPGRLQLLCGFAETELL